MKSLKLASEAKSMEYGVDRMSLKDFVCHLYSLSPDDPNTWTLVLKEILAGIDEPAEKIAPRLAALMNERLSLEKTSSMEELAAMTIYARTYGNGYLAVASVLSMLDKDALREFIESI